MGLILEQRSLGPDRDQGLGQGGMDPLQVRVQETTGMDSTLLPYSISSLASSIYVQTKTNSCFEESFNSVTLRFECHQATVDYD